MSVDVGVANATASATLVDEWVRCGVRHAVVAPGSRSTPMALALAERTEVTVHVVHDERSAAFVALGIGLDGVPAVLLCTSGTAAANFHPAVVEAGLSDVPLLVLTADRPPELRGIGAPQTIDQIELYGRSVRWFHDAPVPDEADPAGWRPLAQRAFTAACAGPVHVNLPFREPLVGVAGPLPDPIGPPLPVPRGITVAGALSKEFDGARGLIIAGGRHGVAPHEIEQLAARLGWVLLADPLSGCRVDAVATFDSLLRHAPFADSHVPDVVVRFGRPPASKVLSTWVADSKAPLFQVGGPGVVDPDRNVTAFCCLADLSSIEQPCHREWVQGWNEADRRADAAIAEMLTSGPLSEPGVARTLAGVVQADAELVVAASMPMRDLEWFGGRRARAHANRGANGIDGVLSTALGRALTGRTTFVHLGDIALLHDSTALVAIGRRNIDLRIVVTDNDGGGIFSFLPQAMVLESERFEQLFGTPHGTDLGALAAAHRILFADVSTASDLTAAISRGGPSLTRVVTDRNENVRLHAELHAAVAAALGS
jgi:2-succinyl-5-enolpyruvyl-6-hydroxy-3-cyclohexene-1-carboxylate synthase